MCIAESKNDVAFPIPTYTVRALSGGDNMAKPDEYFSCRCYINQRISAVKFLPIWNMSRLHAGLLFLLYMYILFIKYKSHN